MEQSEMKAADITNKVKYMTEKLLKQIESYLNMFDGKIDEITLGVKINDNKTDDRVDVITVFNN